MIQEMWQKLRRLLHRDGDGSWTMEHGSTKVVKEAPSSTSKTIRRKDTKKESRIKLKDSFERNQVVTIVTSDDFVEGSDEPRTDSFHEETSPDSLLLPREGYRTDRVPNMCIICFDPYEPGDKVVWSSNKDCEHAFHHFCVLKFLVRNAKQAEATRCCVCRCNFTDIQVEKRPRQFGRRGANGRRTVTTSRNFDALELPSWWPGA